MKVNYSDMKIQIRECSIHFLNALLVRYNQRKVFCHDVEWNGAVIFIANAPEVIPRDVCYFE